MGILAGMLEPVWALAVKGNILAHASPTKNAALIALDGQLKREESGIQPAAKVLLTLSKMKDQIKTAIAIHSKHPCI